jgi:hypothetical protein
MSRPIATSPHPGPHRPSLRNLLLCGLLVAFFPAALSAAPEVYETRKMPFTVKGKKVRGFEIKARETFPYSIADVLDAAHDHQHLIELSRELELSDVEHPVCVRQIASINVYVMLISALKPGRLSYELETDMHEEDDGSIVIEWSKLSGTESIKVLRGRIRLSPAGADGRETVLDYHLQAAAKKASAGRAAKRVTDYLERLGQMVKQREVGQRSLWVVPVKR